MAEYNVGPRQTCPSCGGSQFKPTVAAAQVHVPGGRSERSPWPLKIDKLERVVTRTPDGKIVRDEHDRPVVSYRDVVFHSLAEQNEYLQRTGRERMMDGEADSTVNEESTHSVYHHGDTPAPSAEASRMASRAFYVEDPRAYDPSL